MPEKNTEIQNSTIEKNDLSEYIQGYKIEREYGDKDIIDCIKEIVSIHM